MPYIEFCENGLITSYFNQQYDNNGNSLNLPFVDLVPENSKMYKLKEDYEDFTGMNQWELNTEQEKLEKIDYEVKTWNEFKASLALQISDAYLANDTELIAELQSEYATEKQASLTRIQTILGGST